MEFSILVALSYGLYSQDLPEVDQPPKNIVFIDIGYATTELAAVAFNKGRLKVSSWDSPVVKLYEYESLYCTSVNLSPAVPQY